MIIRIPYVYTAAVIGGDQQRGRHLEYELRGDWAEIEVREVDPADAPLLCQVEGFGDGGVPFLIEVRKIGHSYFRPKLVVPGHKYHPLEDGSDRLLAQGLGQVIPLVPSHHIRGDAEAPNPYAADRYHEILEIIGRRPRDGAIATDNRVEVVAQHEQAARELVVIEGMVWERCLEPRLSIDIGARLPKTVVSVPLPAEGRQPHSQLFPLGMAERIPDMLQEALDDPDFVTFPGARNPRPQWKINEIALANVIYYEPSLANAPWAEALVGARESFNAFPRGGFETYSKDYIVAWVDFRDTLRRAEASPSEEEVDNVMAAWRRASESADAEARLHREVDSASSASSRYARKHSLAVWQEAIDNVRHNGNGRRWRERCRSL